MTGALGLLIGLATLCVASAAAQAPPARWEASAIYTHDGFAGSAPEWDSWESWTGSVMRRLPSGALGLEAGRVRRFDLTDQYLAVDAYRNLWPSAYAWARAAVSPSSDAIARTDLSLEVYQGLPGGWEPSASYRQMRFPDLTVHIGSGTIGLFVGPWYGRFRVVGSTLSDGGPNGYAIVGMLRRYLGETGGTVDVAGAVGSEATLVAGTDGWPLVTLRATSAVSASTRVAVGGPWLLSLGLGHTAFRGVPHRITTSVGVGMRR